MFQFLRSHLRVLVTTSLFLNSWIFLAPPAAAQDATVAEAIARATESKTKAPNSGSIPGTRNLKALRGPLDPATYIVGPGDALAITVWAQRTEVFQQTVSPEGNLVIPGVATIAVGGRTLVDTKRAVRRALSSQYHNVEMSIDLVDLRRIEVHVVGQVMMPGTYVGTALDPTSAMIQLAGGLTPSASRRNILITRGGGETLTVDLERYERLGELVANPPIVDGDVIRVPFIKEQVLVEGAVEAPGVYELVAGESIPRLIRIAGGFARGALRDTVEVREFVTEDETRAIAVAPASEEGRARALRDGDQIYVRSDPEYRATKMITLEGEVRFPGPYGINEEADTLLDVIRRAGGFTDNASLSEAVLLRTSGTDKVDLEFERLTVIPVEDMTRSEYAYFKSKSRERKGVVVVDFVKLAAGDTNEDRLLQDGDRVVLPKKRATVTVSGSVTFPGLITYVQGQDARYYLEKAGGYASTADRGGARVIRGLTGEWESLGDADIVVPGDEVWVPEEPERDWWQFAQNAVRFAASIATIYLVVDQATR